MEGALVFAGGDPLPGDLGQRLDRDRFVIAADSGLDHALALGFHVLVVAYEEPRLVKRFGTAYQDYRNDVPRWIPRIRRRSSNA